MRALIAGGGVAAIGLALRRLHHTGESVASDQALWWPPARLAGRRLASFLVSGGRSTEPLVDR